jgi:hypothetical protein
MSAGTLLTLGADEIVMFDTAQLGPLDMQLPHPVTEKNMSALDYIGSVGNIVSQTNTAVEIFYENIRKESGYKIKTKDAMEIACKNSTQLFQRIIGKIDPVELSRCHRVLNVAKKYGKDFLYNYSLKLDHKSFEYAETLIGHLIYNFPDHSYGICYSEASKFGINIKTQEEYPYSDIIWEEMSQYLDSDFLNDSPHIKIIDMLTFN